MALNKGHVVMTGLLSLFLLSFSIVPTKAETQFLTISGSYKNKVNLTADKEDIFYVDNIAPGDQWNSVVTIENIDNKQPMDVYITDIFNINPHDDKMFRFLQLEISLDDQVIFDGNYSEAGEELKDFPIEVEPGKFRNLNVEVYFPIEAKNEYMNKELKSKWIFEARYDEKKDNESANGTIAKTGDTTNMIPYILVSGVSLLIITFLLTKKRKDRK